MKAFLALLKLVKKRLRLKIMKMVAEVKNLDDLSRFGSSFAQVKFIKSCFKLICTLVRIFHTVISTFLECTIHILCTTLYPATKTNILLTTNENTC